MKIIKQAEQSDQIRIGREITGAAWTAQEALDTLGQTAKHYGIPSKVVDCRDCWNNVDTVAQDESSDPDGYDYQKPVYPMALDFLSNSDLYCEEHSDW